MLGLDFEERLPCLFSDADEHNWYTPKCERGTGWLSRFTCMYHPDIPNRPFPNSWRSRCNVKRGYTCKLGHLDRPRGSLCLRNVILDMHDSGALRLAHGSTNLDRYNVGIPFSLTDHITPTHTVRSARKKLRYVLNTEL